MNNELKQKLIAQAQNDMAQWPQYNNYFQHFQLVRVVRKVKTKLGVAFDKGEIVIGMIDAIRQQYPDIPPVICYSFKNKCDTGLNHCDVEWL